MKTFVIYEVWTRSRIVEAESHDKALADNAPQITDNRQLNLCNWHAVEVPTAE